MLTQRAISEAGYAGNELVQKRWTTQEMWIQSGTQVDGQMLGQVAYAAQLQLLDCS